MSANVSGLFGTTRISMNDNLLNRGSEREILAVLGHEMGHYVLGHVTTGIMMFGLVILAGFAFAAWGFGFADGHLRRSLGRAIRGRPGGPSRADGAYHILLPDRDAADQHDHANAGSPGRHLRRQRRAPARRLRRSGACS